MGFSRQVRLRNPSVSIPPSSSTSFTLICSTCRGVLFARKQPRLAIQLLHPRRPHPLSLGPPILCFTGIRIAQIPLLDRTRRRSGRSRSKGRQAKRPSLHIDRRRPPYGRSAILDRRRKTRRWGRVDETDYIGAGEALVARSRLEAYQGAFLYAPAGVVFGLDHFLLCLLGTWVPAVQCLSWRVFTKQECDPWSAVAGCDVFGLCVSGGMWDTGIIVGSVAGQLV